LNIQQMYWNVTDREGNPVKPLEFEGKTQADVVKEIIEAFGSYDIVFLKSPTGTGKALIGMQVIANAFSAGIIVVPTKHLQKQYYNDFNPESGKFKIPGINVQFILGRNNFRCPYVENTLRCDHPSLPCIRRLRHYEPRYRAALECPMWCPRYPAKMEEIIKKIEKKSGKMPIPYRTAGGEYVIFMGDDPEEDCPYLRQYRAYVESNVIIMNDKLWLIETLAKRKPIWIGGCEVVDEIDDVLQKLTTASTLSERRIKNLLDKKLKKEWNRIMQIGNSIDRESIKRFLFDLEKRLESMRDNEDVENLLWRIRRINDEIDDYIIRVEDKERKIYFFYRDVKAYLRKILRWSNAKILGMSATLQDEKVLREYYGFDNYTIIYGKRKYPGKIYLLDTKRWWITHRNWERIEERVVEEAKRVIKEAEKHKLKTLIQAHAFKYVDKLGVLVDSAEKDVYEEWLKGKFLTLASTRLKRGVDLKDELLRVMQILKHPYPDKSDLRIKHLFEVLPEELAHAVYKDMARRDLIQQIGRGLRHENDWIILAVFDKIALEVLKSEDLWEIEEVSGIEEVIGRNLGNNRIG